MRPEIRAEPVDFRPKAWKPGYKVLDFFVFHIIISAALIRYGIFHLIRDLLCRPYRTIEFVEQRFLVGRDTFLDVALYLCEPSFIKT